MRVNMAIIWKEAPAQGRIEIVNAKLFHGGLVVGFGDYQEGKFSFTSKGLAHIVFAIDCDDTTPPAKSTTVHLKDTAHPFSFSLGEVLAKGSIQVCEGSVTITAEQDVWASL
jgi:hypothetical protein